MIQIPKTSSASRPGFALVATLALMVLLAILAVGLLSLSAVTLRSSGQGAAQAEARANARMALMIAIGELQTHTGADTRVTAPADLLDADAPRLTGVWKSWEGTNHDSTGRPIKPDYSVKNPGSADSRFVTWLVSGATVDGAPSSAQPAQLVSDSSTPGTVPLLAEGSLGDNDGQVHVKPQPLKDGKGRLAWWVSPENQKARLAQPHKPRSDDLAGWVEMGQSHLVPDPSPFGLEALIEDPENHTADPNNPKAAARAITLATSEFIANGNAAEPQHSFHDLSPYAVGLLTNTATGGWRKDMSILTERWDDIYATYPGGKLPLFRFSPAAENTSLAPKPVKPSASAKVSDTNQAAAEAATPPKSAFYPWSRYSTIIGYIQPCTYHAASASWASLQSFATSYKGLTYYSGEVKSPFIWDKIAKNDSNQIFASEIYNHKHQQRLYPQIARFQLLVYATAIEDPNKLGQNPKRYQLRLNYVPLFTLWNPHNVTLEHRISGTVPGGPGTQQKFLGFGWRRSLPGVLAVVDSVPYISQGKGPDAVPFSQYRMLSAGNFQTLDWPKNSANPKDFELQRNKDKWGGRRWFSPASDAWGCWLPEGLLTFGPGEAKVFSADSVDAGYGFGGATAFRLREGYNPTAIIGTEISVSSNLTADRTFWFLFRPDRVTQPYRSRDPGYGFSLSFANGSSHFGGSSKVPSSVGEEYHNITALVNESEGDKYWPPDEVDEVGYSVGELEGQWIPIVSVSFGPRMTIGTGPGMTQNRSTKGVVQNNALAGMVLSDPGSGDAKDHPANNTFGFAYHSLSIGSNITPNLSNSQGFIATGYQSGDGLSRLVMADIPLRPMASLVELQGWNPRGNNPYPPFQMNLIGNSDATPLIPQDDIVPSTLAPPPPNPNPNNLTPEQVNLQHDDAYCANHLLFDDWFVSSIAPQPEVLGGDIAKNIDTFYGDFLTGKETLSNRSYRAIAEDTNLPTPKVAERVQKIVNSADGWLKVASRLEVDGMFNVNSTSVAAWKSLLGHAKSREEIAIFGKNQMESAPAYKKHPVTRGPVAPDVEAGSGPAHGGLSLKASEYAGFRNLTDEQIADLAEKIVEQVRLRGPFLSLAEFVNRQLSSEEDLALAGAVQSAINNLKDDPMKVLRNPANSLSDNTMPPGDPKLRGANYEFAKAAEGSSAYGVPGWIRQADVLRPIAPILSARDDTFTIRAYGDATDASGNVIAKAWCEAVVRRTRDFCDQADAADSIEPPSSPTNTKFGRRYQIVTFRWLNKDEV